MDFAEGEVLYFNKSLHQTSFFLVKKVRTAICRHIGQKKLKVGHAGTLDPLATGVLIVCTGKKTKEIDDFQFRTKEYVATLQLGATTPSFDLETAIDNRHETAHLSEGLLRETLKKFIGRIEQIPPVFSAVKVDGVRAYELARKGEDVELKPKILVIDEIELLAYNDEKKVAKIRVVCSKGTYIRALARDIGQALHSGAHLIGLERTRIGNVRVEDCMSLDDFLKKLEETKNKID